MEYQVYERVKTLLEETNTAYDLFASAHVNADFAEFASMSLSDFKSALSRPELTARQLRRLLRDARTLHKMEPPKTCWAGFMAAYVTSSANTNKIDVVSS